MRNNVHFELHCAPDSPASADAERILVRLETARQRLIAALGLDGEAPPFIDVYLVELPAGEVVAERDEHVILASYRVDEPAVGLERSLAEVLIGGDIQCAFLLDGIVGFALGEPRPPDEDLRSQLAAQDVTIDRLLRGDAEISPALYRRIAAAWAGYLLQRFGSRRYRELLAAATPSDPDRAFQQVLGDAVEKVERDWLQSLAQSRERTPGIPALLARCAGYLRPHWLPCAVIALCLLLAIAFDLLLPLSFRFLIDNAILAGNYGLMVAIIAGLLALFVVQTLATLLREYLAARVGAGVLNGLRARLYQHLQTLSPGFYAQAHTGDLLARYSSDLMPLELVVTRVLPVGSMVLIGLLGSIALLFALEWRLALIVLILLPSFVLGPVLLGRRAAEASYRRQRDAGAMMTAAQEGISGHMVIRAFGLERVFDAHFAEVLDRFAASTVRSSFLGALLGAGGGISMSLVQVVSLGIGAFLVAGGEMTVGALVAFQGLLANVVGPLRELAQLLEMLQQTAGALRHLDEVMQERPRVTDSASAVRLPPFHDELRFEHVWFRYDDGTLALSDVSFRVRTGESLAIVGPSGCGKSTALSLLLRSYDPSDGAITIDGFDLRRVSQASLRSQLGTVFQESTLFDISVRENIRLGRLNASDAEVEEAARLAEVHETITRLPAGYDTTVGEHGGRLSGGQRQRIALARALLRHPTILVLDEPTSALDPETEQAINATLERLRRGRTTITVTHRLEAVTSSDQIVVLEHGKVVECGTHIALLSRRGLYHRLYQQSDLDEGVAAAGAQRLQEVPYFRGLDAVLLSAVAERLTREEWAAGETFFRAGDPGDAFYLIVRGQVEVVADGPGGEARLALLRDGDYFGEMALVESIPRTATVRARTATTVLSIDREQFLALLERLPRLRVSFDEVITRRRANDRQMLRTPAEA